VWYVRNLINPLIVGRFAGETVVGQVALAIRMLDVLSFVKAATYRISISALAQMQSDVGRLRRAVSEGMELQILAMGPVLVLASWIGPMLFPPIFGREWLPVMAIFPWLAIAYLGSAAFNLHCSTLYVLRRNWEVTVFHICYVLLFAIWSAAFVPRFGIFGYGWAEGIAVLTYGIAHLYIAECIGSPDYSVALLWLAAFTLALFSHQLGIWVIGVLVLVLLLPVSRHRILNYIKSLREMKSGQPS
jgi:PST family polysaccharide transporter